MSKLSSASLRVAGTKTRLKGQRLAVTPNADKTEASSSAGARVIGLIEFFASLADEASLSQVSERQGLSRSVAHKLLQLLVDQGLVQCDPQRKTYRVGTGLYKLAAAVFHGASFVRIARPMMRELVERTGQSACLNLLDRDRAVFTVAAVEESSAALQYVIEVGQWHPLHAGAGGKAILAFQPDAFINGVLGKRLDPVTATTVTDVRELRKQLSTIRDSGFSLSKGERLQGAIGIAAPVLGSGGLAVASVQLTISVHHFDKSKLPELRQAVIDTATSIGAVAQAMPAAVLS